MGTVFVFLTLLVLATMGMSALVLRLSPDAGRQIPIARPALKILRS
ncbi:MAG: OadG family protein [Gammaproteobacteria bacterium]|nr:OadG family protein [Gammaproteobacteria bacterium]